MSSSKPFNVRPQRVAAANPGGAPVTILDPIETGYYEQPGSRVSLGNGPRGTGFGAAQDGTQASVAVCMCPAESVIGPVLQRHQDGGMAWGRCPSNLCDASQDVPQSLTRYGAAKPCN